MYVIIRKLTRGYKKSRYNAIELVGRIDIAIANEKFYREDIVELKNEVGKMFLDDSPIQRKKDDLLNRSGFAKKIGQSLRSMNAENGLCIGLFGPWGSGKTSILNMLSDELENASDKEEIKPIVLFFNPWNFTTEDHLFHQFFYMLANQFASSKEKNIKETGDAIKKYANMVEDIGSLIHLNELKIGVVSIKFLANILSKKNILHDKDLSKQRNIIIERLRVQKQRVIIVIDDIDRLPNAEIRLIFQLISTVAKFPNTIYLLSFDRNIVINALTEVQKCDGNDYLEKIVQIPIEIPAIREDVLYNILSAKLDEMINIYHFEIDQSHWQGVFRECIYGHLKTLREINRLINALHAKCIVAGNELDFADLVGITIIENKFPELYYWIRDNKEKLVGGYNNWRNVGKDGKTIIKENENLINQLFPIRGSLYCRMLSVLFPHWAQAVSVSSDVLLRRQRIGCSDIFERYFCLSLTKDEIPRFVFNKMLFEMNGQELSVFLDDVNKSYSGRRYLYELNAAMRELDNTRKLLLAKALIEKADTFDVEERITTFALSTFALLVFQIEDLLRENDENSVFGLLKDEITNADKKTIRIITHLINSIDLSYSRKGEYGEPLITEEHLLHCRKLYCNRIKIMARNTDLLELTDAHLVLYLFEKYDPKNFERYILNELNDKVQILKYLQTFVSKALGTDGNISWAYEKDYNKFLTEDKIKNAFTECLKNGSFWTLSNEMQSNIIAFELWTMDQRDWVGRVPNELVAKRKIELKNLYKNE